MLRLEQLAHLGLDLGEEGLGLGAAARRVLIEPQFGEDDLARISARGHRRLDAPEERVDGTRVAKIGLDPLSNQQPERGLAHLWGRDRAPL